MRTQAIRPHSTIWLLILIALTVIGFFMVTVKPAAQAPEITTQAETVQPEQ